MPNTNSNLLNPTEIFDIYGVPVLNDLERQAHFTLNKAETRLFKTYEEPRNAIYFIVCLVFFKIKRTIVEFEYKDIQAELQHVIKRYFVDNVASKKTLTHALDSNTLSIPGRSVQSRIRSDIINLCGYQRFTGSIKNTLYAELRSIAPTHPRQRQLCKEFLNACVKHNVAIPGYTILQTVVSDVWNYENNRVISAYVRYASKVERSTVLSLLDKTDNLHNIISIKHDMKGFKTHDLWEEIDKQEILKPIFEIAKLIIPKLSLPATTIDYYARLIHYYSGPGLKQLKANAAGLYLLCYTYTRYQMLNDNLLDAFKKRTSDYKNKAKNYADAQSLKYLDIIKENQERVSKLLVRIDNDPHPTYVLKGIIYEYVPKNELLIAAKLLVDEHLNKDFLFWQYIDAQEDSIKLNLRHLFLQIDFIVTNHNALRDAVNYVKKHLADGTFGTLNPLALFKELFAKHYYEYVIADYNSDDNNNGDDSNTSNSNATTTHERIIHNRCEFLLYMQMMYHLSTNKLTLQYSIKHKKLEDEFLEEKKWKKEKNAILKKLDYSKLIDPIKTTLNTKRNELTELYKTVNYAINNNENTHIKIKKNKKGEYIWRLSPIEALINPNDSFFCSITTA